MPSDLSGQFGEPYQEYRWSAETEVRQDLTDQERNPLAVELRMTVERATPPTSSTTLWTVWPIEWFPQ